MFDAIVVGSGISGGWVAKELTEKGLKVLVLERGRNMEHGADYLDGLMPWELPNGGKVPEDEIARDYDSLFSGSLFTTPTIHSGVISAFHLYVVRTAFTGDQKQRFFELAQKNGVGLNVHYIPIYRQPYFSHMGFDSANFPVAEKYYSEAVSIPMYVDLSADNQEFVSKSLIDCYKQTAH